MKLRAFGNTFRGQRSALFGALGVCALLGVIVLVQAWGQAQQRQTVVLVPPMLKGEVLVDVYESSPEYKTAWGLFFANLIGNVTPARVPFVKETLERFIAPSIFQDVIQRLEVEGATIAREQIALSFETKTVLFDASRNLVIVEGVTVVRPAIGKEKREPRTYEFRIDVLNYRPVLKSMNTYQGPMKLPEKEK